MILITGTKGIIGFSTEATLLSVLSSLIDLGGKDFATENTLNAVQLNTLSLATIGGGTEDGALRVTIASDSTGVLSVDDNGGSLTVDAGIGLEVTGTGAVLNATPIAATDVSRYRWVCIQITGTFSAQITFEMSNDNTNWLVINVFNIVNSVGGPQGIIAGPAIVHIPIIAKYFRGRISQYTSGTVNATAEFSQSPAALPVIVASNVTGPNADAATATGNPLQMGLVAKTTNRTNLADNQVGRAVGDSQGRAVVTLGQDRTLLKRKHTQIALSSAETTILTAVSGVFLDVVYLHLSNATATAVSVTIRDSTAGTTVAIIDLGVLGSDSIVEIPLPIPLTQTTANNNWTAQLSSALVTVNIMIVALQNV